MRKFLTLLSGIVCLISLPAISQQLFDPTGISYKPAPLTSETSEQTVPQIQAPNTGLFPELNNSSPYEPANTNTSNTTLNNANLTKKTNNKPSGDLQLILDNVEILNPPAGLALCIGKLYLQNDTDLPLQNLSAEIMFGSIPLSIQFSNVAPGTTQEQGIALAGPSCNQLLGAPKLDIQTCTIPGVSVDDCKSQVKYVPVPSAR